MNNTRIRDNFFTKLGIDEKVKDSRRMKCITPSRGSLLGKVIVTQEPLKFISDEKESSKNPIWGNLFRSHATSENSLSSSPSSSVGSGSTCKKEPRISFNLDVIVVPIPMRDEYSNRVKDRLWTKPEDLYENAKRNALEFAAEGWDWRTAFEDENMYRDAISVSESGNFKTQMEFLSGS